MRNNLKYKFQIFKGNIIEWLIHIVKWEHSNNNSIIKPSLKWD